MSAFSRHRKKKPSKGFTVGGIGLLTLFAAALSAWANATFHPALGNLLPWVAFFIGIVTMIAAALES